MLRFVWEGRVVGYHGRNYVVIDKLGRSGNVILIADHGKYRVMVHKSELTHKYCPPVNMKKGSRK